ncbi:MAG: hypothetical protein LBD96_01420 [Treponema sp.]|jgi:hypothetical protein|nr:hypothetical protein [Treponema sp.]
MNKANWLIAAGTVLAVCALSLTGCPQDTPKAQPDSRLVGTWQNGEATTLSGLYKKFTINKDFTFTAEINPAFIGLVAKIKTGGITTDEDAIPKAKKTLEAAAQGTNVDALIASWTWQVTGTLNIDGGEIYIMNNLEEKNGAAVDPQDSSKGTANTAVAGYNSEKVKITFNPDTSFTFMSATGTTAVTEYFGGTYHKVP